MEHIGQRIRALRKKAGFTQDRLANCLGVSAQAVSKWEVGTAMPDISLLPPLTKLLGCTSDELLGIREPRTEEEQAFDERVERIGRETCDDLPPTFNFQKAADYLRDHYKEQAFREREISDSTIRHSLQWLMEMDELGQNWTDPLGGLTPNYEDFSEGLRERALSGDGDALDFCAALKPLWYREEGCRRAFGRLRERALSGDEDALDLVTVLKPHCIADDEYRRVFALCHILGATEIVNIGCGSVPYIGMLLDHSGFRYTGISEQSAEKGGPERFNRLLRDYAPDVRFLTAKWPDCELETGDGAMGLLFLCHTYDEEPEKCFVALSRQFSRAVVQVNNAEQETTFRRVFDGFIVHILWEQRQLGILSGVERSRQALYFVTKLPEDIALLDEIGYEWMDTRFLESDRWFQPSYYERWKKAVEEREAKKDEQERYDRARRFVLYLRDNVAGICARDDEERRILETQQGAAADTYSESTVGGGVRLITVYAAEKNPERLNRGGEADFLLAEGTQEFEGTLYEYAVYVMDGFARSFVCRESHPERDPDPYDPGLSCRREHTEEALGWMRDVGKAENRELL